jgi:hypothetical protein
MSRPNSRAETPSLIGTCDAAFAASRKLAASPNDSGLERSLASLHQQRSFARSKDGPHLSTRIGRGYLSSTSVSAASLQMLPPQSALNLRSKRLSGLVNDSGLDR